MEYKELIGALEPLLTYWTYSIDGVENRMVL